MNTWIEAALIAAALVVLLWPPVRSQVKSLVAMLLIMTSTALSRMPPGGTLPGALEAVDVFLLAGMLTVIGLLVALALERLKP